MITSYIHILDTLARRIVHHNLQWEYQLPGAVACTNYYREGWALITNHSVSVSDKVKIMGEELNLLELPKSYIIISAIFVTHL